MKYMLMMHVPRGTGEYQSDTWPAGDVAAHMRYLGRLNAELIRLGELTGLEALGRPAQARVVRAGSGAQPIVSDGPFAESKEFLAGYWIVDVPTLERAYEIAALASAAPGRDGVPLMMPIEVREVISAPPITE